MLTRFLLLLKLYDHVCASHVGHKEKFLEILKSFEPEEKFEICVKDFKEILVENSGEFNFF